MFLSSTNHDVNSTNSLAPPTSTVTSLSTTRHHPEYPHCSHEPTGTSSSSPSWLGSSVVRPSSTLSFRGRTALTLFRVNHRDPAAGRNTFIGESLESVE